MRRRQDGRRYGARIGCTEVQFYDRFTPAISSSDFALRAGSDAELGKALDFVAVCQR